MTSTMMSQSPEHWPLRARAAKARELPRARALPTRALCPALAAGARGREGGERDKRRQEEVIFPHVEVGVVLRSGRVGEPKREMTQVQHVAVGLPSALKVGHLPRGAPPSLGRGEDAAPPVEYDCLSKRLDLRVEACLVE